MSPSSCVVTLVCGLAGRGERKDHACRLWLGLSLLRDGGGLLFLGADFLAAAQVLVYVGAVTTVLIFGIMLSAVEELRGEQPGRFPAADWRRLGSIRRRGYFPAVWRRRFRRVMLAVYRLGGLGGRPAALRSRGAKIRRGHRRGDLSLCTWSPLNWLRSILLVALLGAIVLAIERRKSQVTIPLPVVLPFSALLFGIGVYGALDLQNAIRVLMCVELVLNSVNRQLRRVFPVCPPEPARGQVFAIFVLTVAAAEAAVGLAIIFLTIARRRHAYRYREDQSAEMVGGRDG